MIYLDHNATTPLLPEAALAMMAVYEQAWANPSSTHQAGHRSSEILESARQQLAELLDVSTAEIYFTSGGTESDNAAFTLVLETAPVGDIIISTIEHPAVTRTAYAWKKQGFRILECGVDKNGHIRLDEFQNLLSDKTRFVSIMFANHEVGTLQPVEEIGALLHKRNIPFHCDAVQAFGKVPLDIRKNNLSLLSVSAHKAYGPKGVGFLYAKKNLSYSPFLYGGGQEQGLRSGTENVPAIAGMVKAAEITHHRMSAQKELFLLTELLHDKIVSQIPGAFRNGHANMRTAGTLNICCPAAPGEIMVKELDKLGIAASAGAACHAGTTEASSVLLAMGLKKSDALCSLRFSLGFDNTEPQVLKTADALSAIVERIRNT